MTPTLSDLTQEILRFRDERDWSQFHTPRQLAAAVAIEAAELQQVLLWKTDEEVIVSRALRLERHLARTRTTKRRPIGNSAR